MVSASVAAAASNPTSQLRRLSSTVPRSGTAACANAGALSPSMIAAATTAASASRLRSDDLLRARPSLYANPDQEGWEATGQRGNGAPPESVVGVPELSGGAPSGRLRGRAGSAVPVCASTDNRPS